MIWFCLRLVKSHFRLFCQVGCFKFLSWDDRCTDQINVKFTDLPYGFGAENAILISSKFILMAEICKHNVQSSTRKQKNANSMNRMNPIQILGKANFGLKKNNQG